MGKKKFRKAYTSRAQRRSVVNGVKEARAARSPFDTMMNKVDAWKKGLNPWITVPGPSSKMRYVKVRANTLYGDPKKSAIGLFSKVSSDEA